MICKEIAHITNISGIASANSGVIVSDGLLETHVALVWLVQIGIATFAQQGRSLGPSYTSPASIDPGSPTYFIVPRCRVAFQLCAAVINHLTSSELSARDTLSPCHTTVQGPGAIDLTIRSKAGLWTP